jgi:hypothetical protein
MSDDGKSLRITRSKRSSAARAGIEKSQCLITTCRFAIKCIGQQTRIVNRALIVHAIGRVSIGRMQ